MLESGCTLLLSSDWAAISAIDLYGLDPENVLLAPMGAGLLDEPSATALRSADGPLRLLFVGYEWERKGGPLCLHTLRVLRSRGIETELHVVGAPHPGREAGLIYHGVLAKSDAEQRTKLRNLFASSSFFFMPSRAEAYGLVYCEAAAFGLPSVATDTGGVGTIVQDGVTGLLLPIDAQAEAYADRILQVWQNSAAYNAMQVAARIDFQERLNWQAWGEALEGAVDQAIARKQLAAAPGSGQARPQRSRFSCVAL